MEDFIFEIERYAEACGLLPTTVAQRGAKVSGTAWAKWKGGGSCSLRVADRIRKYMAENPPTEQPIEVAL